MSKFTSNVNPVGRYLENGKDFELLEPIIYHVGQEDSEEVIVVPTGSVTDWASIPEFLHGLISTSYGKKAAALHDYLYRTSGLGGMYNRKRCDEIFLEALTVLNVPWRARQTLYSGVRLGGWLPWGKYEKQKAQTDESNNDGRPDY